MRFICNTASYRLNATPSEFEYPAHGLPVLRRRGYTVEFRTGDLTPWEQQIARERFSFRGTVTETDGTPIDPVRTKASSFDTSSIDDPELRAKVESALLENTAFGRDYILVEQPKMVKPWPKYDDVRGGGRGVTTAVAIAERVTELGLDPADVIAYERQNQNREDVIAALDALNAEPAEDALIVA